MNKEVSEKSLQNLKPFPKGVSGNPLGRPKGRKDNATIFSELLQSKGLKETDPTTYLFNKLVNILEDEHQNPAITRQTVNDILDRLFGKPKSTIEHGRTPEDLAAAGKMITQILQSGKIEPTDFLEAEEAEIVEN